MNLLSMMRMFLRAKIFVMPCLLLLVASKDSQAAKIVVIDAASSSSHARHSVEEAAAFYGLSLDIQVWKSEHSSQIVSNALRTGHPLALVITADALPMLDAKKMLPLLNGKTPVLIVGISEHTDGVLLQEWSGGSISSSQRSKPESRPGWLVLTGRNDVVQQLGGNNLPLGANSVPYLTVNNPRDAEWLIKAHWNGEEFPVFARSTLGGREVFFATETQAPNVPVSPDPYRQQAVFAELAPAMLFLRYAAGEYAWHSPGAYANFTIDDLWLREPYGHVNYQELLHQSRIHNFHSTIAFIPWNFDRSEAGVATLFRDNPDRLSICVHGNDHVHQEFGPLDSHPLEKQTAAMVQGLARMEKFHQLTGVPFDAVMVFPHSISPEATLEELRRYKYMATANSLNVPSDQPAPAGADFALRTATLQFAGFPSLRRYSAETVIPEAQLAIDAFLGNPVLFYAHESFFANEMEAFNRTADVLNRLQPSTEWQSLGNITRHLYTERLREDGDYDIRAYSGDIVITNRHGRAGVFYVEKDENSSQPLTVTVDGKSQSFVRVGPKLQLSLSIASGASSEVAVRLPDQVDLASVDTGKHSLQTNAIRRLSDFRDDTVSRSELGRLFIRSYADNGLLWNLAMIALAGGVVVTCVRAARRVRQTYRASMVAPVTRIG